MRTAHEIQISDGKGGYHRFKLARGQQGAPFFSNRTLDPLGPVFQSGEPTYASFLPRVSGVYAQPDLSRGMGVKMQTRGDEEARAKRYYYAEWLDASVPGQIQKGPKVTAIAKPTDAGPLSGSYEIAGTLYLVLGRKVVSYNPADDSLTEVKDLGAGKPGYSACTFFRLSSEAAEAASTATGAADTLDAASDRLAQQVTPDATRFLGSVELTLNRTGSVTGTVRLSVQPEYNGKPSGEELAVAEKPATELSTAATTVVFRYDSLDEYLQVQGEPYWLVLDAYGATTSAGIQWSKGAASGYSSGVGATSPDSGATYSTLADGVDYWFKTYTKAIAATAYIGSSAGVPLWTTTGSTSFSQDPTYEGQYVAVYEDLLVRDCRSGANGAVALSADGVNWGEPLITGDPSVPVTNILAMPEAIIVCTENAIWAIEPPGELPASIDLLYSGGRSATNGVGACVWQGIALIPFDGRLVGITGSFLEGFTVHKSVGPEALEEWQSPWGAGRIVALAPGRHQVYAAMSTSSSYKLLKSSNPLEKEWHGAIADLGTPSAFTRMVVWERGGANSPLLFFPTTSDNLGKIILPRTANPAADSAYQYDTANDGSLYYPVAHGNFHVSDKAWLSESVTFHTEVAGGKVEVMYDTWDGTWSPRARG